MTRRLCAVLTVALLAPRAAAAQQHREPIVRLERRIDVCVGRDQQAQPE